MIVWSFQDKDVLKKINENGEHIMTWADFHRYSPYAKRFEVPYVRIMHHFKMDTLPIWTYLTYQGKAINDDTLEEFLRSSYHGGNPNDVLLKIEVPDEFVHKTSYYDWSDYLYFTLDEPDKKEAEISWKCAVDVDSDTDTIQVLLPFIKKEWIVNIYETRKHVMA